MTESILRDRAHGAMLAAAAGDALGWPQEFAKPNARIPLPEFDMHMFRSWSRRAGGRFQSHQESILAGEYSDDTQLILCTARSLARAKSPVLRFALQELPSFRVYERGAGRATKRSVEAWRTGRHPWAPGDERQQLDYFEAGGNGAAMRVLPIAIAGAALDNFGPVREAINLNAIITHGHPRAVVAAAAYGYVLWFALKHRGPLDFGELLQNLRKEIDDWGAFPRSWADDWLRAAPFSQGEYERQWFDTIGEILRLVETGIEGMSKGALSIERDVLDEMGAFGKAKGAGTISTVSAIFLASRYAPTPSLGLVEAAFLSGSDTDTIASMTGGLLGAIWGTEWIRGSIEQLQDMEYIVKLTDEVLGVGAGAIRRHTWLSNETPPYDEPYGEPDNQAAGRRSALPDGRRYEITASEELAPKTAKYSVVRHRVRADDGQTLYLKRFSRRLADRAAEERPLFERKPPVEATRVSRSQVVVYVGSGFDAKAAEALKGFSEGVGLTTSIADANTLNQIHHPPAILIVLVSAKSTSDELGRLLAVRALSQSARYVVLPPPNTAEVAYPTSLVRGAIRVRNGTTAEEVLAFMRQEFRDMITRSVSRMSNPAILELKRRR